MNNERLPREQWDALTPDEQYNWACLLARSQDELYELLALVPCPEHGVCIPHLRQWIQERLAERAGGGDGAGGVKVG